MAILFISGFIAGGLCGVFLMALVQINRNEEKD